MQLVSYQYTNINVRQRVTILEQFQMGRRQPPQGLTEDDSEPSSWLQETKGVRQMRQRIIESRAGSIPGIVQVIMILSATGYVPGILQRPSPSASECVNHVYPPAILLSHTVQFLVFPIFFKPSWLFMSKSI